MLHLDERVLLAHRGSRTLACPRIRSQRVIRPGTVALPDIQANRQRHYYPAPYASG